MLARFPGIGGRMPLSIAYIKKCMYWYEIFVIIHDCTIMSWNVPIPPRNYMTWWLRRPLGEISHHQDHSLILIVEENGLLNLQLPRLQHPGRKAKGIQKSSLRQLTCEKLPALHGDDLALRLLSHFTCDTVILLSTLPFEPFVSTNLGTNFGARRYLGQDSETWLFTLQPW